MKTKRLIQRKKASSLRPKPRRKLTSKVRASAPRRVMVSPVERERAVPVERPMTAEELMMERDRIYARLVGIPNVISRPSPADYVVFEVADPAAVHRKLVQLGISPDVIQKYAKIPNGMRVFVRSAMANEAFLRALEVAAK